MNPKECRITPDSKVSDIDLESEIFIRPDGCRLTKARESDHVDDLWLKKLRRNAEQRAELLHERDELIVAAKADRVPVRHIAAAADMSPMQMHRIINAGKEQSESTADR